MLLYGFNVHIVNHHLTKFGGLRLFSSRDIENLIFHVALQDLVIKGPCDFMERSSSFYILTLPSVVVIAIVVVDIKWF